MQALITGMTGFVGGHLVKALLADDWDVHGTLLTFVDETPPPGTTGTPVDITDADAMADLLDQVQPEAVFHLAGAASVGQSFADPEGTWKVNHSRSLPIGIPVHMAPASPHKSLVILGECEHSSLLTRMTEQTVHLTRAALRQGQSILGMRKYTTSTQ